jgi:hypothetical protein
MKDRHMFLRTTDVLQIRRWLYCQEKKIWLYSSPPVKIIIINSCAFCKPCLAWMVCLKVWNLAQADYVFVFTVLILPLPCHITDCENCPHPLFLAVMVGLLILSSEQEFFITQNTLSHRPVTSLVDSHSSSSSSAITPLFIIPLRKSELTLILGCHSACYL